MEHLAVILCLGMLAAGPTPGPQREKLVFVLAGQSNMEGSGDTAGLSAEFRKMPANVEYYLDGKRLDFERQTHFGPEVGFAHEIAKACPDYDIVLIKHAVGGTSLLAWAPRWNPKRAAVTWNRLSGPLYTRLMGMIRTCNSAPGAKCAAVLWMQGERDARYPEVAKEYLANLKVLVESFRKDLASPDLPFVLGRINPSGKSFPARGEVRKAQESAAREIPQAALVSTEGLSKLPDGLHYDATGQIELGRRFAAAFLAFRRKKPAAPDGAAMSAGDGPAVVVPQAAAAVPAPGAVHSAALPAKAGVRNDSICPTGPDTIMSAR